MLKTNKQRKKKSTDFQILFQIYYFVSSILTFFLLDCVLFNDWIILFDCCFFTKLHVGIIMCSLFLTAPHMVCSSVLTLNSRVALFMTAEFHLDLFFLAGVTYCGFCK